MNIGQCDFRVLEVTIAKLYNAYTASIVTDQPSQREVRDMWSMYRKALVYSPVIDAPALPMEARDQLAALVAIKRAELGEGFGFNSINVLFRAIVADVLTAYGVSDNALTTIRVLHAVLVGPEEYNRVYHHYPVNEKAFCLFYAQDADAAMMQHH